MKRTYVPPSGNTSAKLAGCGEQPGVEEIRARPPKPFVGPAGRGLDECFSMTKIIRRDLYLTNVIKDLDAPIRHYINIDSRGKATVHPEGYQYIRELAHELKQLNLNAIVAFGNIALFALTNRVGITKWRGSILESTIVPGLKVIPTFHPATFIPPKFNFLNKPLICEDLLRAKHESEFPEIRRKARNIIIRPSFRQVCDVLDYCYEVGLRGQTIALDIEVINGEVDCISAGWAGTEAISIPFRDQAGDYFTVDQELEIMLLVAKILQEERIAKVGANFIFDTQFLLHKYGIRPRGDLHCTQIAQKIAFPDFPAGLDFVTTMHTDIPYYKQDGKQWMKMQTGTWEEWWNYNGMDSIVPVEALPKQMQVLAKQQNLETYERQRRLIKPLIYMSERGIPVDVQGIVDYRTEQKSELDTFADSLNEEIGYDINYNSPQQLMRYFYDECKLRPYKKRNQKGQYAVTTDVDALKRIARQGVRGSKAARIMLDIRSLSKRISTYLNIGKVDKDGRYRSSYKPVGAETGRLSSGETIFGTGGNQQNWPHDLLRFFLFDEGYIGYSFDLSQIENRIVAYVGGVIPQIEAFEQGIDLHRLTASVIFNKPYDQISSEDGSSVLGDGRQSERFWGKKGNHCLLTTTQVLTPNGWTPINIARINNLDIAQWSEDGTVSFVGPSSWFVDKYTGVIHQYSGRDVFQEMTPEHRIPCIKRQADKGKLETFTSEKLKLVSTYEWPVSGIKIDGTLDIHPIHLRLLVAFQADGGWNGYQPNWKLKKVNKIYRLETILNILDIDYTKNPVSGGCTNIYIKAHNIEADIIRKLFFNSKAWPMLILSLNQQGIKVFCDEIVRWDGDGNTYWTSSKHNADIVQTMFHLGGFKSRLGWACKETGTYRTSKTLKSRTRLDTLKRTERYVVDETILCPTVSSGYFLCKERDIISITGNSLNYDVGYKTFALKNEMPEGDAKRTLEAVHRGYPQIRGGYQLIIQNMLKKNRIVTNLFGRNRLFLGPIIPSYPFVPKSACMATYREAYAQLPQSTTADKINEHGIEYTYYNQQQFRLIELLAQIHDSIVFQIPLSAPWEEHARMLLLIKQSLEQPLYWHDTEIKVPADLSIGLNMCKEDMKELKSKEIPSNVNLLAEKLKGVYDDLSKT